MRSRAGWKQCNKQIQVESACRGFSLLSFLNLPLLLRQMEKGAFAFYLNFLLMQFIFRYKLNVVNGSRGEIEETTLAEQTETKRFIKPFIAKGSEDAVIDLKKRTRISEDVIQAFLFISGAISILTTIGIVIVLGRESLSFFTNILWEDTNVKLAQSIGTAETTLFTESGRGLEVGELIRINEEEMEVTEVGANSISVLRGMNGTEALVAP